VEAELRGHGSGEIQPTAQNAAAQISAISTPAIASRWTADSRNKDGEIAGDGCEPAA